MPGCFCFSKTSLAMVQRSLSLPLLAACSFVFASAVTCYRFFFSWLLIVTKKLRRAMSIRPASVMGNVNKSQWNECHQNRDEHCTKIDACKSQWSRQKLLPRTRAFINKIMSISGFLLFQSLSYFHYMIISLTFQIFSVWNSWVSIPELSWIN